MGLVILGADNLASDQADQKPSVVSRPKQAGRVPGPWFEVVDLAQANRVKVIFHNFPEWPEDKWTALKSEIAARGKRYIDVDMSSCEMTVIGDRAFIGTGNGNFLTKVSLPKGLQVIGDNAFEYNSSLELKKLPDTVKEIGKNAFASTGISISELPKNLTKIGSGAFNGSKITIQLIPETVEQIGSNAFGSIRSEFIEIASKDMTAYGVSPVGSFTIGSPNLTKVWIRSQCETIPTTSATWPFVRSAVEGLIIYAEADSKPEGWGDNFNRVGSSVDYYEAQVVYGQKTSPF